MKLLLPTVLFLFALSTTQVDARRRRRKGRSQKVKATPKPTTAKTTTTTQPQTTTTARVLTPKNKYTPPANPIRPADLFNPLRQQNRPTSPKYQAQPQSTSFTPQPGVNCGIYKNGPPAFTTRKRAYNEAFARVLGGEDSDLSDHPWQVYQVGIDDDAVNDQGMTFKQARAMGKAVLTCSCGGTIVSNHYVVTAAHCVFSCVVDRSHVALKTIEMHTNLRSSSLNSAYRGQSKFSVADNIIVHPSFGGQAETVINDIALLHSPDDLLQMIKYKTWMQTMPACLPTADLCANDGAHVRVSGFGKTEYKADSTGRFN